MRLIFLGAPGAGKGTLAKQLEDEFELLHLSTGDILRENIKNQTPLGKLAQPLIDNGMFVPDEIMVSLVVETIKNLNQKGFILDGFPRTLPQAEALSQVISDLKVVYLKVDYDILAKRLSLRRVCSNSNCRAIYNLKHYKHNFCEKCGASLMQREDDKEEVILKRFEQYKIQTAPLIDFYLEKGLLIELDAKGSPDETLNDFKQKFFGDGNGFN